MIKLYQTEWHNIKFNSFTNCDRQNIATEDFYNMFYKEFFEKYYSFDDLDKDWVNYKLLIANQIVEMINDKKNILSIGCGVGIVEKHIANGLSTINITAIEPSKNVSKWINEEDGIYLKNGYFPEVLDDNLKFDLIYTNAIDYVFDNKQYLEFLESIINYGIKEFLMISVSYYEPSIKLYIKEFIKDLVTPLGLYKRGQFWGYIRTVDEQISIMKKAGFNSITLEYQTNDTIILKAKV